MEAPAERVPRQDELEPLFWAFEQQDHAVLSMALFRREQDLRGEKRVAELNENESAELRKARYEAYKHVNHLWWACRSAYVSKYGDWPR